MKTDDWLIELIIQIREQIPPRGIITMNMDNVTDGIVEMGFFNLLLVRRRFAV